MKSKRILSILCALFLITGLLPNVSFAAASSDTDKTFMSGTSHIDGGQVDTIYFGKWQQDAAGTDKSPVKWRVLANNSNDSNNGPLFVIADSNLDAKAYDTNGKEAVWANSTIRTWLQNNFYGNGSNNGAFTAEEKKEIKETDINAEDKKTANPEANDVVSEKGTETAVSSSSTSDVKDHVFLLSKRDAEDVNYFKNNNERAATNTAYVGKNSQMQNAGVADRWWLRTQAVYPNDATNDKNANKNSAMIVGGTQYKEEGYVKTDGVNVTTENVAVRPAFYLNTANILFTAAADDNASVDTYVKPVEDYAKNEWRLILKDSTRTGFTATISSDNGKNTVSYNNAKTGDNEYISAVIKDESGKVTNYARVQKVGISASGTVDINIPTDMTGKTLCIFNEQYNGNNQTGLASNLCDITKNAAKQTSYSVKYILENLSTTGKTYVDKNDGSTTYEATLSVANSTDSTKYALPLDITVKVGGEEKTTDTDYTYDSKTGQIKVNKVNGDIEIKAEADIVKDAQTPNISQHPASATYTVNESAVGLVCSANVSDGGNLTYQWYKNDNGSTEGATLITTVDDAGASSSNTYMPSTDNVGTTYYYCVVTNTNNSVRGDKTATAISNIATITVTAKDTQPNKPTDDSSKPDDSDKNNESSQPSGGGGTVTPPTDNSGTDTNKGTDTMPPSNPTNPTDTKPDTNVPGPDTNTDGKSDADKDKQPSDDKQQTPDKNDSDKNNADADKDKVTVTEKTDAKTGKKTETKEYPVQADGTKKTETTTTDRNGKLISTVTTVTKEDKNAAGNDIKVETVTTENAKGEKTEKQTTTIQTGSKENVVVKVEKDNKDKVVNATAAMTSTGVKLKSGATRGGIAGNVAEQIADAAGAAAKDVVITTTVKDAATGKKAFTLTTKAKNLEAKNNLYILKDSKKSGQTLVNAVKYRVQNDGGVSVALKQKGSFELVTEQEKTALVNSIKKTIAPTKTAKTVVKGKKTNMALKPTLDKQNVKSITYKTMNKKVATVNKKGRITAKKKGTAKIKATVTLKDKSQKIVTMKIKVK